jgi:hypothetical protein
MELVLQQGSDRPRRDLEQGPVLDERPRALDCAAARPGPVLHLQVLDDDHAVVLGDDRGCLVRRVPAATGLPGLQPGHPAFRLFAVAQTPLPLAIVGSGAWQVESRRLLLGCAT